ncbi:pyrokinin-1 receptor-like [Haliotis asinina]|uniref:pyrokinin-1 receptor-like n=1 Tax=Haliotis asinina TaxID=109174 RepID=UPI00353255B1
MLVEAFNATDSKNVTLGSSDFKNITMASVDLDLLIGPKRRALSTVIPMTVVYSLIFVTGIGGNVCTCIVIARNKYMHTATNYYLFNLAVSDLLLLVLGLPQETYSFWSEYPYIFGETFCRFRFFAAEASTYASILTITAFTVERYVAICHPMWMPSNSNLPRAVRVISAIWVISAICSIPISLQFGIVYRYQKGSMLRIEESAQCNTMDEEEARIYFQLSTFLFFVFPMTVLSILYFLIAIAIRRSGLNRSGSDSSTESQPSGAEIRIQQQSRARQSVLKMLVTVVVAFFVCWAPFHSQRLLVMYVERWTQQLLLVHERLYHVSGVFYYISSTINPILYSIMSLKFRQAFRSTLLCPCCRSPRNRNRNSYTYKFVHKNSGSDTICTAVDSGSATRCCGSSGSSQNVPCPMAMWTKPDI